MRRRDLLGLTSGMMVWAPRVRAQQEPMLVIGFLSGATRNSENVDALSRGLSEGGYVLGRNLKIEEYWAEGHFDRLPAFAAELTRHGVALIATSTLPAALAAKAATPTTPVVFVIGEDPVKAGLVASLNHPEGNATGISDFVNQLMAKRLQLLQQTVPNAGLIGLLVNPNNPNAKLDIEEAEAAAKVLGQTLLIMRVATEHDLEPAFKTLVQKRADAFAVDIDPILFQVRNQLTSLAARYRMPGIYPLRGFVDGGGLISYSPDRSTSWHQAGLYAARILRGGKPADLPVQQANKVELVINLKTAKALRLNVPPTILARADEVIE